jgi:gas vesicle protein GvpL/GvpF
VGVAVADHAADRRPDQLLWAYCVLRGEQLPDPPRASGLGPVETVASGALAALVSPVAEAEYSEAQLRRNLNDLAWLERVARAHEAVLEQAFAAGPIVPLRLCTLYESETRVRHMLEREAATLSGALETLDGRQELGVKVLLDPDRLAAAARAGSPDVASYERDLEGRSEGGAYMLRRRLERRVHELARARAREIAGEVHAQLADRAIDAVTHRPQNRELSGHEGEMVLNAAYLVDAQRAAEVRSVASELERGLGAVGARIELTGPWPPFNFVPGETARGAR